MWFQGYTKKENKFLSLLLHYIADGMYFRWSFYKPKAGSTTRFQKDIGPQNSQPLQRNGKHISWEHLRDIYSKTRTESGLALVPRLKYEHVNLTNLSKMRVDLAAQVS